MRPKYKTMQTNLIQSNELIKIPNPYFSYASYVHGYMMLDACL